MAKTLYNINMDFQNAKNKAKELDEIATSIENLAKNDLENCMSSVASNWKGDSSTKYVKKGRQVKSNLITLASNLRTTAETIRTIAQDTYDAEKKALELASSRTYKS